MTSNLDKDRLYALLTVQPAATLPLGTAPLVLYGAGRKGRMTLRLLRELATTWPL